MQPTTQAAPAAPATAAPTPATISRADLPAIGARIGEDIFVGITRGESGDIALYLNAANETELSWQAALDWAAALDTADHPAGTYSLPTRKEQALLFANAAEHFEERWYWSCEQYSANSAWLQDFGDGFQSLVRKDGVYRVRAVRRLIIQ